MATGEVVEQVAEQVAVELEEAARVTRALDTKALGFGFVGLAIGAAVGFYFGYRWNREKIRAEAFAEAFVQSEKEVEQIRRHYQEMAESVRVIPSAKPDLDEVVEERGYSATVEPVTYAPRPTQPPVPVQEPPVLPRRDFTSAGTAKRHVDREKDKNEGWDYGQELAKRINNRPYIIHQDEHAQNEEGYSQVTFTYYAVDAVLADEDESKIENPDEVVGLDNLENFGHGADDFHVLYVRNDRLEIDYEICLIAASYEETVQGLSSDGQD